MKRRSEGQKKHRYPIGLSLDFTALDGGFGNSLKVRECAAALAIFAVIAGTILSYSIQFELGVSSFWLGFWLLLVSFGLARFFFRANKIGKKIRSLAITAAIVGLIFGYYVIDGAKLIVNQFINVALDLNDAYEPFLFVGLHEELHKTGILAFLVVFGFLYGLLLGYFIVVKPKILPVVLFTLPPLFAGFIWSKETQPWPIFLLFFGYFWIVGSKISAETVLSRGKVKRRSEGIGNQVVLLSFSVVIFGILFLIFRPSSYERPAALAKYRRQLERASEWINERVFGDGDIFRRLVLKKHRIDIDRELPYKRAAMIEFEMDVEVPRREHHLRYFVGSFYNPDDRAWLRYSSEETKGYQQVFDEMGYNPLYLNEKMARLYLGNKPNEGFSGLEMDVNVIKVFAPDDQVYLPYGVYEVNTVDRESYGRKTVFDWYIDLNVRGIPKYKVKYYSYRYFRKDAMDVYTDNYSYLMESDFYGRRGMKDSLDSTPEELAYRKVMYDLYTKLHPDSRKSIPESFLWPEEENKIEIIKSALSRFTEEYTAVEFLKDTESSGERDPMDYFLNVSKTGNEDYFYSALTLVLRANGIPARYVHGFYFNTIPLEQGEELKITSLLYAPWCEVYVDGLGWVPVHFFGEHIFNDYTQPDNLSGWLDRSEGKQKSAEKFVEPSPPSPRSDFIVDDLTYVYLAVLVLFGSKNLITVLCRAVLRKRRWKKFHTGNYRQDVLSILSYLFRLWEYEGLKRENHETLAEYLKKIERNINIHWRDMDKMIDIGLRAGYSREKITEGERDFVYDTFLSEYYYHYDKKERIQQLRLKYLKGIY